MVCGPINWAFAKVLPRHVARKMACRAASTEGDCKNGVPGQQKRCSLCRERLRGAHSHPGQWKSELQQFLMKYTKIPTASCVCKACERSVRRGFDGKCKGDFVPRWIKQNIKKQKQCCCVPGCGITSERSCTFAPFDVICEVANVSISEEELLNAHSPFYLCSQHYYSTYSYYRNSSECALCGSKGKHRVGVDRRRPIPYPDSITLMLSEIGNFESCLTNESVACNPCYQFCKRLLQQVGEDIRPAETIVESLRSKVADLQGKVNQLVNYSTKDEIALLHTALFLGEEMLADHAVTFPMVYQKYLSVLSSGSESAVPYQRYKVLLFVGKEFGDLMSSSCPCKRIGRLLYRTKCDPYVMLSYALGA